jgi:hypothetical protein
MSRYVCGVLGIALAMLMIGCGKGDDVEEKIGEMDYTVMQEGDLPENLVSIINERKGEEFGLTYSDEEYVYMVKGYGKQESGGYNIVVDDLYYTQNKMVLATTLVGPAENELVLKAATYPYIAIKVEYIDKDGEFE